MKTHLMLPGPTPVPERVLAAMARPMINHRGEEFSLLYRELLSGLRQVFQTEGEVMILPSAGTGGLEAAVVNFLSPGDRVLALVTGAFGERFATIAQAFGARVDVLAAPEGRAVNLTALAERLDDDAALPEEARYRAVLVTHNETSTGVTNLVDAIAAPVRRHGALLLVDAVSSLGAIDLPVDRLGLDVVVTGAQKALMCPPGLAILSVSERAWQAAQRAAMPRFYWDLRRYRKSATSFQTPYTPALSLLYGLKESLTMLLREEGLQASFRRHTLLGRMTRAGVAALGLELLAAPGCASATVTAVVGPEGVDLKQLRRIARQRYGVILAGGQGDLADRIFRIGHLGHVGTADILAAVNAVGGALLALGYSGSGSGGAGRRGGPVDPARAVAAALQVQREEEGGQGA